MKFLESEAEGMRIFFSRKSLINFFLGVELCGFCAKIIIVHDIVVI